MLYTDFKDIFNYIASQNILNYILKLINLYDKL